MILFRELESNHGNQRERTLCFEDVSLVQISESIYFDFIGKIKNQKFLKHFEFLLFL